jgi:hypothetical protein
MLHHDPYETTVRILFWIAVATAAYVGLVDLAFMIFGRSQ